MKIAIVFTGISYGHGRDFKHCFNNIKHNIIKPIQSSNDTSIYITTYKSEVVEELNDYYSPKKSLFLEFKDSHQVLTYKKSIEQLIDEDIDFIICTRFDIHFKKKISDINIDYTKFNVLFKELGHWKWWSKNKFTSDNLFAFPKKYLSSFINVLDDIYRRPARANCNDLHHVFYRMRKIIGKKNTHIIFNKPALSDFNYIYHLCRKK